MKFYFLGVAACGRAFEILVHSRAEHEPRAAWMGFAIFLAAALALFALSFWLAA